MADDKVTTAISAITQVLLAANGTIPMVAAAIGAIVLIIKGFGVKGPQLKELPALIEAQVAKTGATIDANMAAALRAQFELEAE